MTDTIHNAVIAVLNGLELNYREEDGELIFKVGEDDADITYCITVNEENELLTIVGYFPILVPKENLGKVCEVINELNDKTVIGAFSVDPGDRRPCFRLANFVCEGSVNSKTVQMCLMHVMGQIIHSFQTIAKAMYGGEQFTFTFSDKDED